MEFIRARSNEQKSIRLGQIVHAALELYDTTPYEKITLAAIASKLNFSRANLYKYVSSKEEIFLLVISSDLNHFVEHALKSFQNARTPSYQEFAQQWSELLFKHQRLLQLFSILFTLIEKNVSVQALSTFKGQMYASIGRLEPLFLRVLPQLDNDQLLRFLHMQLFYAAGLYPSTTLSDLQQEAMRNCGIPLTPGGFVPSFADFLTTVLRGMQV